MHKSLTKCVPQNGLTAHYPTANSGALDILCCVTWPCDVLWLMGIVVLQFVIQLFPKVISEEIYSQYLGEGGSSVVRALDY